MRRPLGLQHRLQHRVRSSAAYTLLELMLALALLAALMTVAWSLMGTFRDAELRGWKLSHRTQTIRTAREWLQSDMQHLLQKELMPANATSQSSRLIGNSLGFTASIAPSLDPLPFLEQLMSNPLDSTEAMQEKEPAASLHSDSEAIIAQAQLSLFPAERIDVEYKLTPIVDRSRATESLSLQPTELSNVQFSLTRRELQDPNAAESTLNSAAGSLQQTNFSERVLTAQDLYRQTDSTLASSGLAMRETQLDGLTHVQFQYFDGQSWKREWNSEQAGGLPSAIALCFDFPARSDMQPQEPRVSESESDLSQSDDLLASQPSGSGISFADAALAAEPTIESPAVGESGLMQAATQEVQIVVYVGGPAQAKGSQQPLGSQSSARKRGGFE